jgi:hypothetical protein
VMEAEEAAAVQCVAATIVLWCCLLLADSGTPDGTDTHLPSTETITLSLITNSTMDSSLSLYQNTSYDDTIIFYIPTFTK